MEPRLRINISITVLRSFYISQAKSLTDVNIDVHAFLTYVNIKSLSYTLHEMNIGYYCGPLTLIDRQSD